MSGIDFTLLRQQLPLAQVLDLLGFTATRRRGPQLRGRCREELLALLSLRRRRQRLGLVSSGDEAARL